jgi:hypothetical protein
MDREHDRSRIHQLKAEAAAARAEAEQLTESNPASPDAPGARRARSLLARAERLEAEATHVEQQIHEREEAAAADS